jgi:hypothetical protein
MLSNFQVGNTNGFARITTEFEEFAAQKPITITQSTAEIANAFERK